MNLDGFVVNDCHAEEIARRSLIRYLYKNLDNKAIFEKEENGKRCLKEEIRFHLYVSEPPCGDSSMLVKE